MKVIEEGVYLGHSSSKTKLDTGSKESMMETDVTAL